MIIVPADDARAAPLVQAERCRSGSDLLFRLTIRSSQRGDGRSSEDISIGNHDLHFGSSRQAWNLVATLSWVLLVDLITIRCAGTRLRRRRCSWSIDRTREEK